jgi:quinol monooxygenase YgiN
MIHVIAVITAKPGLRAQLLDLFRANVPSVLAEDGCIEYGAAVDIDAIGKAQARYGDDSFVVIEKWASIEHLRAHAVAPHMQEYGAKAKDLIAGRAIHVLGPA